MRLVKLLVLGWLSCGTTFLLAQEPASTARDQRIADVWATGTLPILGFPVHENSLGALPPGRVRVLGQVAEKELVVRLFLSAPSIHFDRGSGARLIAPPCVETRQVDVLLRGVPAVDAGNESDASLDGLFEVTALETFQTPLGGNQTMYVLEPVATPQEANDPAP